MSSLRPFISGSKKLNEQTGEKLCEVRESHVKEVGRDTENVSDYFISRQKPPTHGIGWSDRFLMPGWRPLNAITVQMYSVSIPFTGTAFLPGTSCKRVW